MTFGKINIFITNLFPSHQEVNRILVHNSQNSIIIFFYDWYIQLWKIMHIKVWLMIFNPPHSILIKVIDEALIFLLWFIAMDKKGFKIDWRCIISSFWMWFILFFVRTCTSIVEKYRSVNNKCKDESRFFSQRLQKTSSVISEMNELMNFSTYLKTREHMKTISKKSSLIALGTVSILLTLLFSTVIVV